VRRCADDPEFASGAARARSGHDFLGCLFRHGRKAFRSSDRQDYRSSLHPPRGEIPERACLDVALAPVRAREHASAVILVVPRELPQEEAGDDDVAPAAGFASAVAAAAAFAAAAFAAAFAAAAFAAASAAAFFFASAA